MVVTNPDRAEKSAFIDDLLLRLTINEKCAQLVNVFRSWDGWFRDGSEIRVKDSFADLIRSGIGSLQGLLRADAFSGLSAETGLSRREGAELANEIQRIALEESRLGIPLLVMDDSRHGQQGIGTTQFPCGLAMASTWNPELFFRQGSVMAEELRFQGARVALAPNLAPALDPRSSRSEELLGKDAFLAGELGAALVRGLQGDALDEPCSVASMLLFFGSAGLPEGGLCKSGTVQIGDRILYSPPNPSSICPRWPPACCFRPRFFGRSPMPSRSSHSRARSASNHGSSRSPRKITNPSRSKASVSVLVSGLGWAPNSRSASAKFIDRPLKRFWILPVCIVSIFLDLNNLLPLQSARNGTMPSLPLAKQPIDETFPRLHLD